MLGAVLVFRLTQMLGQHRGCASSFPLSFRHRFWGGMVRADLVYIIFSLPAGRELHIHEVFLLKNLGVFLPSPCVLVQTDAQLMWGWGHRELLRGCG